MSNQGMGPGFGDANSDPGADYGFQPPGSQGVPEQAPPADTSFEFQGVVEEDGPRIIQTDADAKDGLTKCARCGSTDISLNANTGLLRCNFCRYEWTAVAAMQGGDLNGPIGELIGLVLGSGADDIIPSTETVLTFKCSACGAEVVIDTDHSTQARCHWCRNTLSMNQQIANGAVPDVVLPFKVTKAQAIEKISEFVKKRKFFANRQFTAEFNPQNVMGVYLPYMVIDVNAKASLTGQGEHEVRSYTVGSGDNAEKRYDADLYNVWREFEIEIDDLTLESSQERLDQDTSQNTNNIINSVMPFDVENAVRYDSNYLSGFTSQRRDTNIDGLIPFAETQASDVARHKARETLKFYDRGVRWDKEEFEIVGQRWVSAYLPVWLYSYQQTTGSEKGMLHYVAVNGRTGETMGSVPVNKKRLVGASIGVEIVGIIAFIVFLLAGW